MKAPWVEELRVYLSQSIWMGYINLSAFVIIHYTALSDFQTENQHRMAHQKHQEYHLFKTRLPLPH